MRDADVRSRLWATLKAQHEGDRDTLMLNELGLWHGHVRVDVAVVNGEIHGFELKSARDTLERLPRQVSIYSAILDRATLVAAGDHVSKAAKLIPVWWGLQIATGKRRVKLHEERPAQANPAIDPARLASLLWREEALDLLERHRLARGVRGKPREVLYARMAGELPLDVLRDAVRGAIKRRAASGWRSAPQRPQRDG